MDKPLSPRKHTLEDASDTRLKILQKNGKKTAVKLEQIFWSQLTEFAKEDRTTASKLIFSIFEQSPAAANKTSLLRCYCVDRMRKRNMPSPLAGHSFDLFALVAACPSAVAIITKERKLAAFNPAFADLINTLRQTTRQHDRAIQLSFSEPLPKIQSKLLENPHDIKTYHLGVQLGDGKPRFYNSRFAIADRTKGVESLIIIFLETLALPA